MTRVTFEIENEDVQATAEAMMEEVSHWGDTSVKIVETPSTEDLEGAIEDLTAKVSKLKGINHLHRVITRDTLQCYVEYIMSLMEGDTHMIDEMIETLILNEMIDENHELIHRQDD